MHLQTHIFRNTIPYANLDHIDYTSKCKDEF